MAKTARPQSGSGNGASTTPKDKWGTPLDSTMKGQLTWADVDPEDLVACLAAVTEDGAALLLSKTSDGGALLVQVLADHSKPKWYPVSMAMLTETLSEITERAKGH